MRNPELHFKYEDVCEVFYSLFFLFQTDLNPVSEIDTGKIYLFYYILYGRPILKYAAGDLFKIHIHFYPNLHI